ncbi:helix-turn-helix transcriptional regulator [Streptomyces sp. ISL-10]|nr:helix-turn-helix transcriptional regulator [Streptomyces sp. ISL-10]MBT2364916.1 helix-turn-helix transcriptional regulator [Streptomyces sp. ISL-10]
MAGRAAPTARRLRVASELRRLREGAGLSSTQAAQRLGVAQGQLSNVETARFGVSGSRIRALAHVYSCADNGFVDALAAMAEDRSRGWWEEYRDILPVGLLDLAELEHHGTRLRTAHTAHIPGLLQTPEHAREIYRQAIPELPPSDIEHRISHRMKRQAVLYRTNPIPYQAIIHEAALRMQFGGPEIARVQLQHLVKLATLEHLTIRVLPFAAGSYPGSGQSINYVHGAVPRLDTVQLDQSHGVAFVDGANELSQYRELFARLETLALPPDESRTFVHNLAESL